MDDPPFVSISTVKSLPNVYLFVPQVLKPEHPSWFPFLEDVCENRGDIEHLTRLNPSFVLIIKRSTRAFVITGGSAFHIVGPYVDRTFGMELLSRVITEDEIISYRNKFIIGDLATREERSRRKGFGIRTLLEGDSHIVDLVQSTTTASRLQQVFNLPLKGKEYVRLEGKSSFTIFKSLSVQEILRITDHVDALLEAPAKFHVFGGFSEVKHPEKKKRLHQLLLRSTSAEYRRFLEQREEFEETVGLSYYSLDEVDQCDEWTLRIGKASYNFGLFDIYSMFESLMKDGRKHLTAPDVEIATLEGRTGEVSVVPTQDLSTFLYGVCPIGDESYVHFDNRWLLVESHARDRIDRLLDELMESSQQYTKMLPDRKWGIRDNGRLEAEKSYMDGLVMMDPLLEFLHEDFIRLDQSNRGELCDLACNTVNIGLHFIKRGVGSQIRELCAQVRSSAWQLRFEPEYVREACAKFQHSVVGEAELVASAEYVLVVVDYKKHIRNRSLRDRLTFIAKLELSELLRFFKLFLPDNKLVILEVEKDVTRH